MTFVTYITTFFASFFYCLDKKVKVLFSFKMKSKQFCFFDHFNLLPRGYYSSGF